MSEEKFCYIHKDQATRLTCTSCGRSICPKCMIGTEVGYKCPDCTQVSTNKPAKHKSSLFLAIIYSMAIGTVAGLIWSFFKGYGFFISGLIAYAVGFCIAKSMTKFVENEMHNTRNKVISGIIAIISMVYNPLFILINLKQLSVFMIFVSLTFGNVSNILNIFVIIIGVWAAVRHIDF